MFHFNILLTSNKLIYNADYDILDKELKEVYNEVNKVLKWKI